MKRLVTIVIAFAYFAVSSGIIVNMHYCMGKLSGVTYNATVKDHCGKCGMDNTGCCHNDVQIVKLDDAQNIISPVHFELSAFQPLRLQQYFSDRISFDNKNSTLNYLDAPNGKASPPLHVLNCSFRI